MINALVVQDASISAVMDLIRGSDGIEVGTGAGVRLGKPLPGQSCRRRLVRGRDARDVAARFTSELENADRVLRFHLRQ